MDFRLQRQRNVSPPETAVALYLLPLCYDREIKDLTFLYKALYAYIDVNVNKYIVFI